MKKIQPKPVAQPTKPKAPLPSFANIGPFDR